MDRRVTPTEHTEKTIINYQFATQEQVNKTFVKKADKERLRIGNKMIAMKKRSYLTGIALAGVASAFYFYTMGALKQSKVLEDFDYEPADLPSSFDQVAPEKNAQSA